MSEVIDSTLNDSSVNNTQKDNDELIVLIRQLIQHLQGSDIERKEELISILKYNDDELIKKGDEILIKELGISGYRRYLRLHRFNNNGQDYLKMQEEQYKDISLDELFERAAENHEEYKENKKS